MEVPVEATVHVNHFQDEREVRKILRSHGFALTELGSGQVRVEGNFLQLKAVKARLEQLVKPPTMASPYFSPPVQAASSGAIPKYQNDKSTKMRSPPREGPLYASPASPTTSTSHASSSLYHHPVSQEYGAHFSPQQSPSPRPGSESFVVDADVFSYADQLRRKQLDTILTSHNVVLKVQKDGDSSTVILEGKNAKMAASKLQSLLGDLTKSLRTQEVPWKDMDRDGEALLEEIRKSRNICHTVLVCERNDGLHLIGPSSESYELKQKLLGRPVNQAGRTGRTFGRNSRQRSSSAPPVSRKGTDRKSGAIAEPPAGGAAGYSPLKHQDDKQKGAELEPRGAAALRGQRGSFSKRSHSESRPKKEAERPTGFSQEREVTRQPPNSVTKFLTQLMKFDASDIKQKLKKKKNRM